MGHQRLVRRDHEQLRRPSSSAGPSSTIPGPVGGEQFPSRVRPPAAASPARSRCCAEDYLCRFGDAPSGFHSATGDQLAFAATFGTRVDTVDLTAVMEAYRKGKAGGYLGELPPSPTRTSHATVEQITRGRHVLVEPDMRSDGRHRLYHAFRAIIRANGYTSAAFRCWPESNEDYIGISSCVAMGLLLANGDVTAAACESDWPTAVVQTIGTLLSGKPAAVPRLGQLHGGSEIVQLGHCGVGICGRMAPNPPGGCLCDAIAMHPVLRQAGKQMGPVHVGQFEYGPKTGLCLSRGPDGKFRMLSFRGESRPETAKGLAYSAADVRVADPRKLNRLILDHGFPHHLAAHSGRHLRGSADAVQLPGGRARIS